jgi:hypothetical protein
MGGPAGWISGESLPSKSTNARFFAGFWQQGQLKNGTAGQASSGTQVDSVLLDHSGKLS